VYNIEKTWRKPLSSDHIAEFAFTDDKRRGWVNKQYDMHCIKKECTRQGLRNGSDYVFLNPAATSGSYDRIQIYFEDASYVSYMILWWECRENQ
jgi:hypothetical protein